MATTDRLRLPRLAAAQAQKEMTHNEALTLLDAAVQATVVASRQLRSRRRRCPASAGSSALAQLALGRGMTARSPSGLRAAGASLRHFWEWQCGALPTMRPCGECRSVGTMALSSVAGSRSTGRKWSAGGDPRSPIRRAAPPSTRRRVRRLSPFSAHCADMA